MFSPNAQGLEELSRSSKEPQLAEQIRKLQITRQCDCDDDFCCSSYTQVGPAKPPWDDAHCIELEPRTGMIVLDVVSGRIAHVEVLYRDDLRDRVRALFP